MALTGISSVGGVAAKAATPWLALGGIGTGLLGGLFGKKKKAPSAGDINSMFGAGALSRNTLSLYNMLAQSPQFRNALSQNALAGSRLSAGITGGLANRGLTTSGIGTVAQQLGGSAGAFGEGALMGGLFGTAGGMAEQNLQAQLAAWTQLQGADLQKPSFMESLSGSLLGGGGMGLLKP